MEAVAGKLKVVWSLTERGARTHWARVGVAWEEESGVIVARLDAIPISGRLCIKSWIEPERVEEGGKS